MLADVYMQDCCAFPVPGNGEPAYDSAFRVPENGEPTRVLVPGNPEPICVPRSQERNPKLTPLPKCGPDNKAEITWVSYTKCPYISYETING
jgi:hypothetical protein